MMYSFYQHLKTFGVGVYQEPQSASATAGGVRALSPRTAGSLCDAVHSRMGIGPVTKATCIFCNCINSLLEGISVISLAVH